MLYEKYIQSAHWATKRSLRLNIDKHACQGCYTTEALHVHHKTYLRLGNENIKDDLVTLCEVCHDFVHKMHKEWHISLLDATNRAIELLKLSSKSTPVTKNEKVSVGNKDLPWLTNKQNRNLDKKSYKKLNGL